MVTEVGTGAAGTDEETTVVEVLGDSVVAAAAAAPAADTGGAGAGLGALVVVTSLGTDGEAAPVLAAFSVAAGPVPALLAAAERRVL